MKNCLCNVLFKILIKIESTLRCTIKEQTPTLTLLFCGKTVRSSYRKSKTALENSAISIGNTYVVMSFLIFKITFLKNNCKRLFFDCFNGSLLHGPNDSRSVLHGDIKLQDPSLKSSFLFLKIH